MARRDHTPMSEEVAMEHMTRCGCSVCGIGLAIDRAFRDTDLTAEDFAAVASSLLTYAQAFAVRAVARGIEAAE